jgi:spermidine dehydrogenase
LAGFQASIIGRFWVSTEAYTGHADPDYAPDEYPHVRGRRPFGRIRIANSDAGARALLPSAIDQAHRAVEEL